MNHDETTAATGRRRLRAHAREDAGSESLIHRCRVKIGCLSGGYGGLDLNVPTALGGFGVWHAEIDPDASSLLDVLLGEVA
ncbi:hypothetical protein [Amycolatopsis sp. CA-230715]|uniref:hypothetical protein n=1 Tax=Amycolatopsis sp. CA-230715 TaxID=2745196 RepID=UPI001C039639|nr:hypothetical protein [Amycolatopsis sp. CA-230715]QWF80128.1 hypothetical protein HUW46_03546 [Amycolatopsis sp. CA-230715]